MRTRLTSLESEKLILNNDIIELTSANETMKQEYQQLQHKVKGYEMQVEKLRKEIQSYTLIIKEQTSTIKTLESQVNAKNNKVVQLEKQNEKDKSMIETLNKEVNSVNVTNDEMKVKEFLDKNNIEFVFDGGKFWFDTKKLSWMIVNRTDIELWSVFTWRRSDGTLSPKFSIILSSCF